MSRNWTHVNARQFPLRVKFQRLCQQINLPQHQDFFAKDVVQTHPELAENYLRMFGDNRTDLFTMHAQAGNGDYTNEIEGLIATSSNSAAAHLLLGNKGTSSKKNVHHQKSIIDCDESLSQQQQKQDVNNNHELVEFQEKYKQIVNEAITRFLFDCQLIHDNCIAFNTGADWAIQMATDFIETAKSKIEQLHVELLNDCNNILASAAAASTTARGGGRLSGGTHHQNQNQNQNSSMIVDTSSSETTSTLHGGKASGTRRGRTVVTNTTAAGNTSSSEIISITSSSSASALPTPTNLRQQQQQQQIHTKTAQKDPVEIERQKYINHPQVSGPIAIDIPSSIRERVVKKHLDFASRCSSSPGSIIPKLVESTSSSSSGSSKDSSTTENNSVIDNVEEKNLIVTILRDFFYWHCKNRCPELFSTSSDQEKEKEQEQKTSNKSNSKTTESSDNNNVNMNNNTLEALDKALLEVSELGAENVSCPFTFTHNNSNNSTTTVPRVVDQYWAVITKVIIPYFDASVLHKYLYLDERARVMASLAIRSLLLNQTEEQAEQDDDQKNKKEDSAVAASSSNKTTTTTKDYPWHRYLHFDVLIRSLFDVPIVATVILRDSMSRYHYLNRDQYNKDSDSSTTSTTKPNFKVEETTNAATNVIASAVKPVVEDLLKFIADRI